MNRVFNSVLGDGEMSADPLEKERGELLVLLARFGEAGADGAERRGIAEATGYPPQGWPGMTLQDDDPPGGHLVEWVGGSKGSKTHMRVTTEGKFWAAAHELAKEKGQTVVELLTTKAGWLSRSSRIVPLA